MSRALTTTPRCQSRAVIEVLNSDVCLCGSTFFFSVRGFRKWEGPGLDHSGRWNREGMHQETYHEQEQGKEQEQEQSNAKHRAEENIGAEQTSFASLIRAEQGRPRQGIAWHHRAKQERS